jgi:hypothetical protein
MRYGVTPSEWLGITNPFQAKTIDYHAASAGYRAEADAVEKAKRRNGRGR